MNPFAKLKYFAFIVLKNQLTYDFLAKKRINPLQNPLRFRNQDIHINIQSPTYVTSFKRIYFIEFASNTQLAFEQAERANLSPSLLHKLYAEHAVRELTSGMKDKAFQWLVGSLLMGALLGFFIGYIFGNYLPLPGVS